MLVLSRKRHQSIFVDLPDGQRAVINIADIKGDKVRIGLEFPQDCTIVRDELAADWNGRREAST